MGLFRRLSAVKGELLVPLLLVSYATYYYLEVRALPRPQINLLLIQPVYFILLGSALLFIGLTIYRAARDVSTANTAARSDSLESEGSDPTGRIHVGRSLAFAFTTVGYIFLITPIGFVTMSIIYLVVLSFLLGVRSWLLLTLVPLAVVGSLYVVMEHWLNLPLPAGMIL